MYKRCIIIYLNLPNFCLPLGPSRRGAGSGGRIVIKLTEQFLFRGVLAAWGGQSSTSAYGSPGTVYIETHIGDDEYKLLMIDNLNRGEAFQVLLNEPGMSEYKFDEVKLVRNAVLALAKVLSSAFFLVAHTREKRKYQML